MGIVLDELEGKINLEDANPHGYDGNLDDDIKRNDTATQDDAEQLESFQ